jgi:hypothetical protein
LLALGVAHLEQLLVRDLDDPVLAELVRETAGVGVVADDVLEQPVGDDR